MAMEATSMGAHGMEGGGCAKVAGWTLTPNENPRASKDARGKKQS